MLRNMTSIYLSKGAQMLLLYRQGGRVVSDVWVGSAGGHFENAELNDPEACVLRELREEIGLGPEDLLGLSLRYICLRQVNGEIRQNYYFFAHLRPDMDTPLRSCEGQLRWFSPQELQALEMPCTAKAMLEHYLAVGQYDKRLYCGAVGAQGVVFTQLTEG